MGSTVHLLKCDSHNKKFFPGRVFSALIYFCIALSMLTTVNLHMAGFQLCKVQRTHRLKQIKFAGNGSTLSHTFCYTFILKIKHRTEEKCK